MDEVKQSSTPQAPIPSNSSFENLSSKIIPFIIVAVFIALIGAGTFVFGTTTSQTPVQKVVSQPSPTPIDETANWKTYRNTKYAYELKYPLSFNIKEYDNYTLFTDNIIDLSIINYNTGTDQPILNTELIKIGGESAKRYNHILGKFPNQVGFIIIQLSHNNKDLTITAQSLNKKPLYVDQIEIVDQVLSTFKFTDAIDTSNWKTYEDDRYGYEIKYPSNWYLVPTAKEGYGAVATISNYDTNKSSEKTGFTEDTIKVQISVINKPIEKPFKSWAAASIQETLQSSVNKDYGMILDSQKSISVNGVEGIQYLFKYNTLPSALLIYLPKNSTDVLTISAVPSDSKDMEFFDQILSTFQFSN